MHRFQVTWNGIQDKSNPKIYIGYLKWDIPKQFVDKGEYAIKFLGTEEQGVYFAIRILPNQTMEAFGYGEALIEQSRAKGDKIKLIGEIDFKQPYIIRRVRERFEISSYTDTTELVKLFDVLNQWLHRRTIPLAKGQPFDHLLFDKTDYEMGNAITFHGKKSWRWKNNQ